jgi:hypothetical protein
MTQLEALILSLALEVPVAVGLAAGMGLRRGPAAHRGLGRVGVTGLAATLLTHPFAWTLLPGLEDILPLWARILLVEGGVAVVEGLMFARLAGMGWVRGQVVGWTANAVSFGAGVLIFW